MWSRGFEWDYISGKKSLPRWNSQSFFLRKSKILLLSLHNENFDLAVDLYNLMQIRGGRGDSFVLLFLF
jgi:hypothetical protein